MVSLLFPVQMNCSSSALIVSSSAVMRNDPDTLLLEAIEGVGVTVLVRLMPSSVATDTGLD